MRWWRVGMVTSPKPPAPLDSHVVGTRWHHIPAAAVIVFAAWLQVAGLPRIAPTVDEPHHLVSGLAFWTEGDSRLSWGHAPLGNIIPALLAIPTAQRGDLSRLPQWPEARTWELATAYAQQNYGNFRSQLQRARLGVILLTVLMGIYTYAWCFEQFGQRAALFTLTLLLFNPTVLAHGRLMTNDLAITFCIVLAAGEFVRYLQRPGWGRLATMALATGAAFSTKWSAVALVPVFLAFGLHYAWRGRGRFAASMPRPRRLFRLVGEVVLVCLITIAFINASYRFQRTFWTVDHILSEPESPQLHARGYAGQMLEEESPLSSLPGWLRIPVPYSYLYGAINVKVLNKKGQKVWFMGELKQYGSLLYFPILIGAKTPPALLVLLVAGLFGALVRRQTPDLALAVPIGLGATFLVLAMSANINIGVRHVLPVVAMLAVVAGVTAGDHWHLGGGRRWFRWVLRATIGILLLSTFVSTVVSRPHWLGYFNVFVGGRAGGHQLSIVGEDWGQDIVDLANEVKRRQLTPVAYAPYYPTQASELAFQGVSFLAFSCGDKAVPTYKRWVAVHATVLRRFPECYPWSTDLEPTFHVNHHILVFDLRDSGLVRSPD